MVFFILYVTHYIMRTFAFVPLGNISFRKQMEGIEVFNSRRGDLIRFVHLEKSLVLGLGRDPFGSKFYNLCEI